MTFSSAWAGALRPDPDLLISDWADQYRFLSSKSSSEPGRWRTDRTPYLREIMNCLSPRDPVQKVVFMAGAQVGKTECGNNWLAAIITLFPGPTLAVQPTVDIAMKFSKQRIAPLIDESPAVKAKIKPSRSRDSGNTLLTKEFPGGVLMMGGANSAAALRSMPIKNLFADEVDAWPEDVEGEGDPLQLAERRTTTFPRRKIFICSTPTVKDASRIEREYLRSDQRRYFVPCPDCNHYQTLKWPNLNWQNDEIGYICENCGVKIPEWHKTWMLQNGRWQPTSTNGDSGVAGFHISSLYSPLGWKSWSQIIHEFLASKSDSALLKVWVNTVLGETFEDQYVSNLKSDLLQERAEFYNPELVPSGGLVVTCGVDVQDNRLAVLVCAWGVGEECWILDYQEVYGDPSDPHIWGQLDKIVLADRKWASGYSRRPDAIAIDSGGHFTHEAYQYSRERRKFNVLAVKGQSSRNKPIIGKPTKVDVNYRGQTLKGGGRVFLVGTDTAKTTLYGRLGRVEGAGVIHFHQGLTTEFYEQLTSEKKHVRYSKGFAISEWVKISSKRNEALDCFVYAYAALNELYQKYDKRTMWEQFAKKQQVEPVESVQAPVAAPPVPPTKPPKRRPSNPKSFITNW